LYDGNGVPFVISWDTYMQASTDPEFGVLTDKQKRANPKVDYVFQWMMTLDYSQY
jgi:hypothetical protein